MIVTCIYIFFARLCDVSIGTIRTFYSLKGKVLISTVLSFLEVFIWFIAARDALNTPINSIFIPVFYSLGYATGNLIGTYFTNNYIKGNIFLQIITKKSNNKLLEILRNNGYAITVIKTKRGYDNKSKEIMLVSINKKFLKEIISIIRNYDSEAFIIQSDSKEIINGYLK